MLNKYSSTGSISANVENVLEHHAMKWKVNNNDQEMENGWKKGRKTEGKEE